MATPVSTLSISLPVGPVGNPVLEVKEEKECAEDKCHGWCGAAAISAYPADREPFFQDFDNDDAPPRAMRWMPGVPVVRFGGA